MALELQKKKEIIEKYRQSDTDTGSPQVQIALLTVQIDELAEHLKEHKKDKHSRRGLVSMVGRRRKMISYLSRKEDEKKTKKFLKELGLE